MGKCIIMGAGEFCNEQIIDKKSLTLDKEDFCIAADGGFAYLQAIGITPHLLIGDMDSLEIRLPGENDIISSRSLAIKKLPVEKDDTDMLAAVKEGLARGYQEFALYGALGGRMDHTFANIQCLHYLLNRGARGVLYGIGIQILLLQRGSIVFPASMYRENRRISVFAYGGDAYGVTEQGLKYTLDKACLKQEFPIGVSNEFTNQESTITVEEGMLLICVEDFL